MKKLLYLILLVASSTSFAQQSDQSNDTTKDLTIDQLPKFGELTGVNGRSSDSTTFVCHKYLKLTGKDELVKESVKIIFVEHEDSSKRAKDHIEFNYANGKKVSYPIRNKIHIDRDLIIYNLNCNRYLRLENDTWSIFLDAKHKYYFYPRSKYKGSWQAVKFPDK